MRIAAFFDVDGTLLPGPSLERRFLRYLAWRGELGVANWARWLAQFCARVWRHPLAATDGNKAYLAGVPCSTMEAWLAWMNHYPPPVFPEAAARMEWHAAQGHLIFLVSGTLQPLAEAVARYLPTPAKVCATQLESGNGRWSGRTMGSAVCGKEKARAVARLAAEFDLDLPRSFAYGDRYADRWMVDCVGHAVAVNPSPRLASLARGRGWPVLRWTNTDLPEVPTTCPSIPAASPTSTLVAESKSAPR